MEFVTTFFDVTSINEFYGKNILINSQFDNLIHLFTHIFIKV